MRFFTRHKTYSMDASFPAIVTAGRGHYWWHQLSHALTDVGRGVYVATRVATLFPLGRHHNLVHSVLS